MKTKEIDFLEDINDRFATLESDLEHKLNKLLQEEEKLNKIVNSQPTIQNETCSMNTARIRNIEVIKALEISKARLRSRTTFSPLESILGKSIKNYQQNMSLVPTRRKIYGPTFV